MKRHVYLLAALAAASLGTATAQTSGTGGAQGQGNAASRPGAQAPVRQPAAPPAAKAPTPSNPAAAAPNSRIPPASRGVGTTSGKPDCSAMRGLEKSECERRDTVRDDLPAGVTTTQPKKPE